MKKGRGGLSKGAGHSGHKGKGTNMKSGSGHIPKMRPGSSHSGGSEHGSHKHTPMKH